MTRIQLTQEHLAKIFFLQMAFPSATTIIRTLLSKKLPTPAIFRIFDFLGDPLEKLPLSIHGAPKSDDEISVIDLTGDDDDDDDISVTSDDLWVIRLINKRGDQGVYV